MIDYLQYLDEHPDLDNSTLADIIVENEDPDIKRDSVMRSLQRHRDNGPSLVGRGKRGDSYRVSEDQYIFTFKDHTFDIPREQIAAACAWYVNPNGLTTREVCQRLWSLYKRQIDEDYMSRVFRCLSITKSSSGMAPHIVAEWDEEEVTEFFLKMRRDKIIDGLDEDEQYEKLYQEELKKTLRVSRFLSSIKEHLQEPEVPEFNVQRGAEPEADIGLVLTDWHVGQKHAGFDKDIYIDRIDQLADEIKFRLESYPGAIGGGQVFMLGDMLDGPLANMRPEQGLDQDLHHEEQVIYASKGMAKLIAAFDDLIDGDVKVQGLGGNHGRVGPNRNDDPTRFGDKMSYVLAKEMLSNRNIEWNIVSGMLGQSRCRNTQILYMHGDRGTGNAKDLIWANRDPDAQSFLVLAGHYHTMEAKQIAKDMYFFRSPAICGQDDYTAANGYDSTGGQLLFEVRDSGPLMPMLLPVR